MTSHFGARHLRAENSMGGADNACIPITWQRVTSSKPELGLQFRSVMSEMDPHYAEGDWDEIFSVMTGDTCEYFVGQGPDCEVVAGYQWDGDRERYQIRSVGFRGAIPPHDALSALVDLSLSFLREKAQSYFFAIIPHDMKNPTIMQMHALIPWRRDLKVTGGHHVQGGVYWRIEPAEA